MTDGPKFRTWEISGFPLTLAWVLPDGVTLMLLDPSATSAKPWRTVSHWERQLLRLQLSEIIRDIDLAEHTEGAQPE